MCLRYYVVTFRGARPQKALLTGAQCEALRLQQALAHSLGIRIETLNHLNVIRHAEMLGAPEKIGQWATALGLASYETAEAEVMA